MDVAASHGGEGRLVEARGAPLLGKTDLGDQLVGSASTPNSPALACSGQLLGRRVVAAGVEGPGLLEQLLAAIDRRVGSSSSADEAASTAGRFGGSKFQSGPPPERLRRLRGGQGRLFGSRSSRPRGSSRGFERSGRPSSRQAGLLPPGAARPRRTWRRPWLVALLEKLVGLAFGHVAGGLGDHGRIAGRGVLALARFMAMSWSTASARSSVSEGTTFIRWA